MASPAPPADFDLDLLRALDRLLATRSVSGAARALAVGQPAMSKTLARLREHFGDPLLVRVGHALVPTPRGAALALPVREALEAAGRALARPEPFAPATATGHVVLAMPEHVHTTLGVPLIERLASEAPGLDLRIRNLVIATRGELIRGEVGLAILPDASALTHLPKTDLSQFVVRPLYRDRYAVARAKPARGKRRAKWTLEAYVAARHVLVTSLGESDVGMVDGVLDRRGLRRRIALTVPGFLDAARIVASTDLVATLPERMLRGSGYALDLQPPPCALPELPMLVCWHPRDTHDPRHRWLRERLAACAAEAEPTSARRARRA